MKIGKYLIGFLVVSVLLVASPVLGTLAATAGLGYVGYKALRRIGSVMFRTAVRLAAKEDQKNKELKEQGGMRTRAREKAKNVYYDRQTGEFHAEALPVDMRADLANAVQGRVSFSCAGMQDCIQGFPTEDGGYRFRFTVDDLDAARRVSEFSEGAAFRNSHGDASIRQAENGVGYVVESGDARSIRALVMAAFPPTRCEVEQEVRTVNQYVIHGCGSYEEAVAKFNRDRSVLRPERSFVERTLLLDGVEKERTSGSAYAPLSLEAGTYVISEVDADVRKASISVPGNITNPDSIADFAACAFDSNKAEKVAGKSFSHKLLDATPEHVSRYLEVPDGTIHLANEASIANLVSLRQPQFVFRCADMKEAGDLLSGKTIPQGRLLLLDTESPKPGPGEFIVTIPATADMLSSLRVEGDAAAGFMRQYSGAGIDEADIHLSLIEDSLSYDGYVTARSVDALSTENARINGVPASELSDRLRDSILPSLETSEEMSRWLADAAEIQSISVTLDAKKSELRVSSVVGGTTKTEVRRLSESEMADFAKRGELTKAEMKDFLMQTHPDYFRTYSDGNGGGTVQDPVSSFLKGEKPRMAAAGNNVHVQSPAPAVGEALKPVQEQKTKRNEKSQITL